MFHSGKGSDAVIGVRTWRE